MARAPFKRLAFKFASKNGRWLSTVALFFSELLFLQFLCDVLKSVRSIHGKLNWRTQLAKLVLRFLIALAIAATPQQPVAAIARTLYIHQRTACPRLLMPI